MSIRTVVLSGVTNRQSRAVTESKDPYPVRGTFSIAKHFWRDRRFTKASAS